MLLAFLFLISASASVDASFINGHEGEKGVNYHIETHYPFIMCEISNKTSTIPSHECTFENTEFMNKRLGCQKAVMLKYPPERYAAMNQGDIVLPPEDYEVVYAGCWPNYNMDLWNENDVCSDSDTCTAYISTERWFHKTSTQCCCLRHDCNQNITVKFVTVDPIVEREWAKENKRAEKEREPSTTGAPATPAANQAGSSSLIIVVVLLAILSIVIVPLVVLKRKRLPACWRLRKTDLPSGEEGMVLVTVDSARRKNNVMEGLTIGELLDGGEMGNKVQKARYVDPITGEERSVIVKTVKKEKQFIKEETAYLLLANKNEHIARFIGTNYIAESSLFQLVIEYEPNGDLQSYLKTAIYTPTESLVFLISLLDGLAYLHRSPDSQNETKPIIVHRDIKSKNVVVRANGSAALVDFGLAEIHGEYDPKGNMYQVGTVNYMPPEVLKGQANCKIECLRAMDVYSVALIMWEVLNRTQVDDQDEVCPAELPFEKELTEEIAAHKIQFFNAPDYNPREEYKERPKIFYMKKIVHDLERRPVLREKLNMNHITYWMALTTTEMWEWEIDGRLSAASACTRLEKMLMEHETGQPSTFPPYRPPIQLNE